MILKDYKNYNDSSGLNVDTLRQAIEDMKIAAGGVRIGTVIVPPDTPQAEVDLIAEVLGAKSS